MKAMKRLALIAVALFGAGQAMAREDVVMFRWPSGLDNAMSASQLIETGMGGSGDAGAALKTAMLKGTTVINESGSTGKFTATVTGTPSAVYIAKKFVIPYTQLGWPDQQVRSVRICADDGSATNWGYVSQSITVTGMGATPEAWTIADKFSGLAGCNACREYKVRSGAAFGTIWWGVEQANGITGFRVTVDGR